jgi:hypothetical protein
LASLATFSLQGFCGDDWVLISSNENINSYYNSSSIKIDKENKIIKVWVKDIYTEKGRIEYLKDLGSIKQKYYKDIKYDLVLLLLNYKEWKYSSNHLIRYSTASDVLFDYEYPLKWISIDPNSGEDLLFNNIIKDYKIER